MAFNMGKALEIQQKFREAVSEITDDIASRSGWKTDLLTEANRSAIAEALEKFTVEGIADYLIVLGQRLSADWDDDDDLYDNE